MKGEKDKLTMRLLSVPLMLVCIFILDVLKAPNPMILLIILVVYFTYSDGYISGILGGLCSIVYNIYFFILKTNDPHGFAKLVNIFLAVTIVITLVGKLKAREQKILKELIELNDAMSEMATTDKLTGATNRHAFLDAASEIYESSIKLNTFLALFFIDIDNFKHVNDTYGHVFGDDILSRLSHIIKECIRENDLSCRYGGDEFIILLTSSNCDNIRKVANRIMDKVRQARFEDHRDFRFTVSIGIACVVPSSGYSLDDWIATADIAMYEAKETGRNRFVLKEIDSLVLELV